MSGAQGTERMKLYVGLFDERDQEITGDGQLDRKLVEFKVEGDVQCEGCGFGRMLYLRSVEEVTFDKVPKSVERRLLTKMGAFARIRGGEMLSESPLERSMCLRVGDNVRFLPGKMFVQLPQGGGLATSATPYTFVCAGGGEPMGNLLRGNFREEPIRKGKRLRAIQEASETLSVQRHTCLYFHPSEGSGDD